MVKAGKYVEFAQSLEVKDYNPKDGPMTASYSTEMSILIELAQKVGLMEEEIKLLKKKIEELEL